MAVFSATWKENVKLVWKDTHYKAVNAWPVQLTDVRAAQLLQTLATVVHVQLVKFGVPKNKNVFHAEQDANNAIQKIYLHVTAVLLDITDMLMARSRDVKNASPIAINAQRKKYVRSVPLDI